MMIWNVVFSIHYPSSTKTTSHKITSSVNLYWHRTHILCPEIKVHLENNFQILQPALPPQIITTGFQTSPCINFQKNNKHLIQLNLCNYIFESWIIPWCSQIFILLNEHKKAKRLDDQKLKIIKQDKEKSTLHRKHFQLVKWLLFIDGLLTTDRHRDTYDM